MTTPESAARQALFDVCPRLQLPAPWTFVAPDDDIRGPVRAPGRILPVLREQFDDETLLRAGILDVHPTRGPQLSATLRNRHGVQIALRTEPGEAPFDLLTTRGLLAGGGDPVLRALDDARTRRRAFYCDGVIACGTIAEVALLDSLGLPATLGCQLSQLSLAAFQELDRRYGEGVPTFIIDLAAEEPEASIPGENCDLDSSESMADAVTDETPPLDVFASPPLLILCDWDVRQRGAEPQPWVRQVAARVAELRRQGGLTLAGIAVWRSTPAALERLNFAVCARDAVLVRRVLLDSLESVADVEVVLGPEGPPAPGGSTDTTASATLYPVLPEDEFGLAGDVHEIEARLLEAELATEELLIRPLLDFAMGQRNIVVRNMLAQLAGVARLAHRLGLVLQTRESRALPGQAGGAAADPNLVRYLAIIDRFGRLASEVRAWLR